MTQRRIEQQRALPGAPGFSGVRFERERWLPAARAAADSGARLLALWTTPASAANAMVRAALLGATSVSILELELPGDDETYPGLDVIFPAASRMQRAAFDLTGIRSTDADRRPWLRHAAWPETLHPLRPEHAAAAAAADAAAEPRADNYDFVRVTGDGVHEIAVGPVHAGIIEPGHFRFSVVGEKTLKLEERLGYVHKGIEHRFTDLGALEAHRLAARVSGDSAVAFSWAYAQALEGLADVAVPPRAAWLRALYLELERVANHLGDLGALGNDAGFAFGLAQFSRLKELLLRAVEAACGRRYLLDAVVPGGVAADLARTAATSLVQCVAATATATAELRDIYENHSGVRDRFVGAGRVPPALAARLSLGGLAGRASGQGFDARVDLPCEPFAVLAPRKVVHEGGDVAARVAVRFDEIAESCRLIAAIIDSLPDGKARAKVGEPRTGELGVGLVEGWRGPCFVALEAGPGGTIRRCHPHDVSWQNWPALEHAVIDNIVPDFPLINKSFNLSYSGHDL